MATIWSVILNRMDKAGQKFWTEWRTRIITQSAGPQDAGTIPMVSSTGQLDPSLIPGSTAGSEIITTMTAGAAINAYQMVAVHSDGLAYRADSSSVADASQTIGMAITSAVAPGNTLQVQQVGYLSNLGWNWPTPGKTLYLGLVGTLTTNPNTGVFELPVGTTISNVEVELQIGLPIIFA